MHKILIALAVAALIAGTTAASEQTEVMASVNQFVDSFNKGDATKAVATCADETSIIDEFPPHEWHGPGACSTWMKDYDVDAQKNGITDGVVTLSKPSHVDINADRAYIVVSADYAFKKQGKQEKETGSILVLALKKGEAGWRIIGWTWAKH